MKDEILSEMLDDIAKHEQKAMWTAATLRGVYEESKNTLQKMGYTVEVENGKHTVYREGEQ